MKSAFSLACAACLTLAAGCTAGPADDLGRDAEGIEGWQPPAAVKQAMAKDIVSRLEWDFYRYESEAENVARIDRDCDFVGAHLKQDDSVQVIVTIGWRRPDGRDYLRGAHGCGPFYVYDIRDGRPVFLGEIVGDRWWVRSKRSGGLADITTDSVEGWQERRINRYEFRQGQYREVSSIVRKAGH